MTFGVLSGFVGRRGELREIKDLLSGCRVITLTGPGGVGKSRLAHRTADCLRRAFADGVRYLDLAEVRDGRPLADVVADALGLDRTGTGTALATLTAALAPRPVLLVLDNCEHVLPACAVLVGHLLRACPRLRVIATSREPLRLEGEVIFPVRPLPIADSVALFVARAQAVSDFALTDGNEAAVTELCRRLDGLPLAIELAATRMRTSPQAVREAPRWHPRLRACVDRSYELCSTPERLLWARLSVFPGTFALDAAEGVGTDEAVPAQDLLDLVAGLVDKSILISESSGAGLRYRMVRAYRDYGRERLHGRSDELRRRHRDWYHHLVRRTADNRFGPGQVDWFDRMDHELPNLRVALTLSLADPAGVDAALDIAGTLWPLWAARGRPAEGRRWLDLALARATPPTLGRVEALFGSAALAAAQGDVDAVGVAVRQIHAVADQLDDSRADAIVACADGTLAALRGDAAEAVHRWRRAAERLTGWWRVVALAGLGTAAALLGDADLAGECHRSTVELCPPSGDFLLSGMSLGGLGLALWHRGDPGTATVRLREGLLRLRRIGHLPGIAWCLEVLAWTAGAEQAATLLGAAAGLGVPAHLSGYHGECARRTRTALGESGYRAAFARGEAMSVDEAVAYGLGRHRQRPAAPAGEVATPLTAREQQVALLVAEGRTNRDIAETLVIASRTAECHIESILTKLGLANRAQVAAWITARHGVASLAA